MVKTPGKVKSPDALNLKNSLQKRKKETPNKKISDAVNVTPTPLLTPVSTGKLSKSEKKKLKAKDSIASPQLNVTQKKVESKSENLISPSASGKLSKSQKKRLKRQRLKLQKQEQSSDVNKKSQEGEKNINYLPLEKYDTKPPNVGKLTQAERRRKKRADKRALKGNSPPKEEKQETTDEGKKLSKSQKRKLKKKQKMQESLQASNKSDAEKDKTKLKKQSQKNVQKNATKKGAKEESSSEEASEDEESDDDIGTALNDKKFNNKSLQKNIQKNEEESSEEESEDEESDNEINIAKNGNKLADILDSDQDDDDDDDDEDESDESDDNDEKLVIRSAEEVDDESEEEESEDDEGNDKVKEMKKKSVKVSSKPPVAKESDSEDDEEEEEEEEESDDDEEEEEEESDDEEEQVSPPPSKKPKVNVKEVEECHVVVSNLPFSATKDDIINHIKTSLSQKEIIDFNLKMHNESRSKGIGHLTVSSSEAAQKAISLHHSTLQGREINVFLDKLGPQASQLKDKKKEKSIKLKPGHGDPSEENDDNDARKLKKQDRKRTFSGNEEREDSTPNKKLNLSRGSQNEEFIAFIANVSFDASVEDLKEHLDSSIPEGVVDVRIVKTPNGKSRGFAYATLSSQEALEQALSLSGSSFAGRKLFVDKSTPRNKGNKSDGGFKKSEFGGQRGFNKGGKRFSDNSDGQGKFNKGGNRFGNKGFNKGGPKKFGGNNEKRYFGEKNKKVDEDDDY